MTSRLLTTHTVEKPWGRTQLWPGFEAHQRPAPVGEIWFQDEADGDDELLVKYLFTSEKLSVQVHPDDHQAKVRGYARGKDEAWLILAAEIDSSIALGPKVAFSEDAFRSAIHDGSIADVLDWRPVKAGDFIYSPAGTVHAIGAGLTLIEVQQNLDLTYRLYDYGRPRELHVEDGVAVASLQPFEALPASEDVSLLAAGPKFVVERITGHRDLDLGDAIGLLVPVDGNGEVDGQSFQAGQCWKVSGTVRINVVPDAMALLAYAGDRRL